MADDNSFHYFDDQWNEPPTNDELGANYDTDFVNGVDTHIPKKSNNTTIED